jgi:hypothetical protein
MSWGRSVPGKAKGQEVGLVAWYSDCRVSEGEEVSEDTGPRS